ncbi:hypothetical protein BCR34DRAFT_675830 [Clohesyomyces aquaticus]|uniref:Uncharacterized protein n=1 Tax=Clohesyomyces aquaticus TaxID=1231657 RepID=A0A1Y1Z251_9PLEO|nr:hypothetical protein BCR34DRAFT_675830 [Clohesyomyces aquaticus]
MGSKSLPFQEKGIYHNLPTFSKDIKGLTAIVTGANGISGVYAVSGRPPPPEMIDLLSAEHRARVDHVGSDFLLNPKDIAQSLKGKSRNLKPELRSGAWSKAQQLVDVDSALLDNFLNALPLVNLTSKRVLLQTSAKNYGANLGHVRSPYLESDRRANNASWNIICPAWIIGAVNNAAMNALHPPRSVHRTRWRENSTAMLAGYLGEWAVLEYSTANQKCNASDGYPLPVNRLYDNDFCRPETEESKYTVVPGAAMTALGYEPPPTAKFSFTLSQWATRPENAKAWEEIMKKDGVTHGPFEEVKAHFTFGNAAAFELPLCLRCVDTLESLNVAYGELHKLKMLPPLKAKAQPLI